MKYSNQLLLCSLLFLCPTYSVIGSESKIKKSVGIGYYFSEGELANGNPTNLSGVPLFLKLKYGKTSVKISSNALKYDVKEKSTSEVTREEGFGDSNLSVNQLFKTSVLVHYLDIGGKIKIPATRSNKELGTSGYDFTLSSTAYYWLKKNWLSAEIAHKWRRSKTLNNTYSASLGASRAFSKKFSAGVLVDYEEARQSVSKNLWEYTIYTTWKAHKQTRYSFYYIKGFEDLKLKWASGLQVSFHW